jgi:hypothetical protein
MGAKVFNLFFLVCTGRGQDITDITSKQYEDALKQIYKLHVHIWTHPVEIYGKKVFISMPKSFVLFKATSGGAFPVFCR